MEKAWLHSLSDLGQVTSLPLSPTFGTLLPRVGLHLGISCPLISGPASSPEGSVGSLNPNQAFKKQPKGLPPKRVQIRANVPLLLAHSCLFSFPLHFPLARCSGPLVMVASVCEPGALLHCRWVPGQGGAEYAHFTGGAPEVN